MNLAPFVALQTGALAGLGPCGLSRAFLLRARLKGLPHEERRLHAVAFGGGLVAGYLGCGAMFAAAATVIATSPVAYGAAATACFVGGSHAAWQAGRSHVSVCKPQKRQTSAGATFAAGALSTLVGSPCCGPITAALAGSAFAALSPRDAHSLIAAYAIGHAVPVLGVIIAGDRLARLLRIVPHRVSQGIMGGVLFGLGGYYAISA
jgi:cytochrome c biogenesis protein CcdA